MEAHQLWDNVFLQEILGFNVIEGMDIIKTYVNDFIIILKVLVQSFHIIGTWLKGDSLSMEKLWDWKFDPSVWCAGNDHLSNN